ncbi:MAG: energy-coupling factor transporter transmembrane protein EcfT [Clostridiales bacterium]|nr:energy-coupling factor transporter transmembrane protein EcfT [Clostridiales bacterium]
MGGFLDYIPGDSLLHRLNPLTKMILAVVLCAACFVSGRHLFVLGVLALSLAMSRAAGVFQRAWRTLAALSKLSLLLFVVQVLVIRDGKPLLTPLPGLSITDVGVLFSLLFVLRLIAATLPLAIMLSVTKIGDLSGVLVEKLRIPFKYAFSLTTAMRFIPIFSLETADIMAAQTSRGVEFDTRNFLKKVRLILPLCVPLLLSSVERIDRGAISAELRGFSLRKRGQSYRTYAMKPPDWGALALAAAVAALSVLL